MCVCVYVYIYIHIYIYIQGAGAVEKGQLGSHPTTALDFVKATKPLSTPQKSQSKTFHFLRNCSSWGGGTATGAQELSANQLGWMRTWATSAFRKNGKQCSQCGQRLRSQRILTNLVLKCKITNPGPQDPICLGTGFLPTAPGSRANQTKDFSWKSLQKSRKPQTRKK